MATSTHDSKRGEDVRARLCALTEMAREWETLVEDIRRLRHDRREARLDDATELMTYQTLVGAWPIEPERLVATVLKSSREAGCHTSWERPDPDYEDGLARWTAALAEDPEVVRGVEALLRELGPLGDDVMLSWALLRATAPGVPDLYQGCELPTRTLVDPDNRRPVDHAMTERLLPVALCATGDELSARRGEGLAKLAVTARTLGLRARRPELFGPESGYLAIHATGPASGNVIAYGRTAPGADAEPAVVVVTGRLRRAAGEAWVGTGLELPDGRWRDCLNGSEHLGGRAIAVTALLSPLPVALLELEG